MTKRPASELFEDYYRTLIYSLPMKDATFMDELLKHDLLTADLKIKLESLSMHNQRASYFLDTVIKFGLTVGNNRCFVNLLTIMKSSTHDNVKELAKEIENELAVDIKCSSKPLLKDLHNFLIPNIANYWYEVGIQLFNNSQLPRLEEIRATYSNDLRAGCFEMLKYWLKITPDATWDNLIRTLREPGLELFSVADYVEKEVKDKCAKVITTQQSDTPKKPHSQITLVTLTTMVTLPIIIFISLFTTGINTNSYCYQQLQIVANNIKQNCTINNTAIKTCCDVNAFYFFTKPYEMQYWCGGKWVTTNVLCDTTTADGGWTVIQRRVDGSENFNRPWSDYEKGFGNLTGEFWYGLRAINCLTQAGQWELRIDFEFKNTTRSYLHYNVFKVGNASEKYPLTISEFTGITHTDPFLLHQHNGMKFSTYDNDNDPWCYNCAEKVDSAEGNGGWWYNTCWTINLNIKYNPAEHGSMYLTGTWYNPRWIEMKIRPLNCIPQ